MIDTIVFGGLGNRMRSIASAVELSRSTGHALRVFWLINNGCNSRFQSLFLEIPNVDIVNVDMFTHFSLSRLYLLLKRKLGLYGLVLKDPYISEVHREGKIQDLVAHHNRVLIRSCSRFFGDPPYYREFRVNSAVSAIVESEINRIGSEYISVHIRRTDNEKAKENSPTALFIERISEIIAQNQGPKKFFVATDDLDVESQLRGRFGDSIVTYSKKMGRDTQEGMRDALVDLILLSRGKFILGSYWSSFSRTASEIGQIEQITVK